MPEYRWFCEEGIVYVEAVPAINAPDLIIYGDLYLAVGTNELFIEGIETMDYEEWEEEIKEEE